MGKPLFRVSVAAGLMVMLFAWATWSGAQQAPNQPKMKEFRIERSMSPQAVACIECHKRDSPGIFTDWAMSRHASANITCIDCHQAEEFDKDVSQEHYKQYEKTDNKWGTKEYRVPVSAVVTPKDCSRCHPDEATQYKRSKHANTQQIIWEIDPWLKMGMNSDVERTTGCYTCHGTVLKFKDGHLDPATWPNVGVGRINFDGEQGKLYKLPHPPQIFGHGSQEAGGLRSVPPGS